MPLQPCAVATALHRYAAVATALGRRVLNPEGTPELKPGVQRSGTPGVPFPHKPQPPRGDGSRGLRDPGRIPGIRRPFQALCLSVVIVPEFARLTPGSNPSRLRRSIAV